MKRTTNRSDYYNSAVDFIGRMHTRYRRDGGKARKLTILEAAVGQSEPLNR